MADFVAGVAEEESGRWRRAKLGLPLAHESGGGDYATDSNATWRDLTLTPRMRPRAEAAVPRTWPNCGGSEPQDTLEMCKQHLNALSVMARSLECFSFG